MGAGLQGGCVPREGWRDKGSEVGLGEEGLGKLSQTAGVEGRPGRQGLCAARLS